MEWPQSGERLKGRQKMREFQEAHAGARPSRRLRRVLVREGLWVVEGIVDYGGGREVDFVLILELRDGKVFRETRYYADPFERRRSRGRNGSSGWSARRRPQTSRNSPSRYFGE
jgi:hypothetical protein